MYNKLITITAAMLAFLTSSAQMKSFTISGKISGKNEGYIYKYGSTGIDSSLIADGKFEFKGKISGPEEIMLMMDKDKVRGYNKIAQIYIEPTDMTLNLDYNNFNENIKLTGSNVQKESDILNMMKSKAIAEFKPLKQSYDKAVDEYRVAMKQTKDEQALQSYQKKIDQAKEAMYPVQAELKKNEIQFMDKYPQSLVTASILRYHVPSSPREESLIRYEKLPKDIKDSPLGQAIKMELDKIKLGAPGSNAFMFSGKEPSGDVLNLIDFKGKYVLIDFWASWCVPCRKGNPHLIDLYKKYKGKGFEIIGVADDDNNIPAWKGAIEKDQIGIWKHVLAGKKQNSGGVDNDAIPAKYGIYSLPTKILIDKNGIIVGRYGGGGDSDEAMDRKLEEIFK